ncbi:MAG: hypothetical protein AB2823_07990, partial [Candidatus Thiodiazotropha endolucinida]
MQQQFIEATAVRIGVGDPNMTLASGMDVGVVAGIALAKTTLTFQDVVTIAAKQLLVPLPAALTTDQMIVA